MEACTPQDRLPWRRGSGASGPPRSITAAPDRTGAASDSVAAAFDLILGGVPQVLVVRFEQPGSSWSARSPGIEPSPQIAVRASPRFWSQARPDGYPVCSQSQCVHRRRGSVVTPHGHHVFVPRVPFGRDELDQLVQQAVRGLERGTDDQGHLQIPARPGAMASRASSMPSCGPRRIHATPTVEHDQCLRSGLGHAITTGQRPAIGETERCDQTRERKPSTSPTTIRHPGSRSSDSRPWSSDRRPPERSVGAASRRAALGPSAHRPGNA
jgi:hypothetical protein